MSCSDASACCCRADTNLQAVRPPSAPKARTPVIRTMAMRRAAIEENLLTSFERRSANRRAQRDVAWIDAADSASCVCIAFNRGQVDHRMSTVRRWAILQVVSFGSGEARFPGTYFFYRLS